jgi:phage N-6-adenine-methyltransferase
MIQPAETALKRTGAALARGKSKQDYGTPTDFLQAVTDRFGPLAWDLAATAYNRVAPHFISEEENSFIKDWHLLDPGKLLWLNPPFDRIEPWACKCRAESLMGARILFLVPASVGSNWYANYIHGRALVLFLSPRLKFGGCEDPYPKDLMLAAFSFVPGFECWRWKQ